MSPRPLLELAVQDVAGARVAAACAADRVELCSGLAVGGLTPSSALVDAAVATGVPVHVLVRPRTGGFVHDDDEAALLLAEVRAAVAQGAAGVVVGVLREARGSTGVDERLLAAARRAADGAHLVFHRAFDLLLARGADGGALLDQLHDAGVDTVLTSGGARRAVDAPQVLSALVEASRGRVAVMAGAGVRAADAGLLAATGVQALHASLSVLRDAVEDDARRAAAALGEQAASWSGRTTTDPDEASALAHRVRQLPA